MDQGVDIHELITVLGHHGHKEKNIRCVHVTFMRFGCDSDVYMARDLHDSLIAKWEARQLIMVQASRISASIYLFVCTCTCVVLRNARSTSFSARAYS